MVLALFGLDVAGLLEDLIRGLLDLLVPDFASDWGTQLVSWLAALPNVTSARQFHDLNAFRSELTYAAWGLLSLSFAVGAMQYWAAGLGGGGAGGGIEAAQRAVLAAGALAVYPTLVSQGVAAVNTLTAAMVRHPEVTDGLDKALGGAFVLAAVSTGLTLGLAVGAVLAVTFFLAAILVMKVALTAMLCVLLVSGALVIALYPLPLGDGLLRLWCSGVLVATVVPVSWAVIFSVAGLVTSDALAWSSGLGSGLEAIVKPFVAVACFYLAYRAPAFLLAQARLMGVRVPSGGRWRQAPGQQRVESSVRRGAASGRQRFAGLGVAAARPAAARAGAAGAVAMRQTAGVRGAARRQVAGAAVSAATLAGTSERAGRVVDRVVDRVGARERKGYVANSRAPAGAADTTGSWWRRAPVSPDAAKHLPGREPDAGPGGLHPSPAPTHGKHPARRARVSAGQQSGTNARTGDGSAAGVGGRPGVRRFTVVRPPSTPPGLADQPADSRRPQLP